MLTPIMLTPAFGFNISMEQRFRAFPTRNLPLQGDVIIHWNAHKVPFIKAESDNDGAFVLGLVHAHLRLGQMEMGKRIAYGRLAEVAGPFFTKYDAAIRAIGFGRSADAILAAMPATSRTWLDNFVAGVNYYKNRLPPEQRPKEYDALAMDFEEQWRPQDSIALGRLGGTDINWISWFHLLKKINDDNFPQLYRRLTQYGTTSTASFLADTQGNDHDTLSALGEIFSPHARIGSNSFAISPKKSAAGAAIIANDPHLGLLIPNIWLLAGLK
ncbi:MAG: penicillin acylase family protein, partial [Pseudomonadota bacterium]